MTKGDDEIAKQNDQIIIEDITQLSIEDLKKWEMDDLLIYINEIEDKKTVIIYFLKIIKQIINSTDLNAKLIQYRKKYRESNDLEDRLDLIYGLIEQNYLLLDDTLKSHKMDLEKKLERTKYTDLDQINDLDNKNKKIDYETSLNQYTSLKEEIRLFFGEICDVLSNTLQVRFEEDGAFNKYMAMYAEARNTPELTSQQWLTNALDNAYQKYAIESGMITKEESEEQREMAMKIQAMTQAMNEQKAKEFYETTKILKKQKGVTKQ